MTRAEIDAALADTARWRDLVPALVAELLRWRQLAAVRHLDYAALYRIERGLVHEFNCDECVEAREILAEPNFEAEET